MTSKFSNVAIGDTDDLFDQDVVGDGPVATFLRRADGSPLRYAAAKYGQPGPALGMRDAAGNDMGPQWARKGTASYALPINGQQFTRAYVIPAQGTGFCTIGFRITGGNTYQVYYADPSTSFHLFTSGGVPAGAASVQVTWGSYTIDNADSGGSITNAMPSPTSLSSNPDTHYTTSTYGPSSGTRGRLYSVNIKFFNASGASISNSNIGLHAGTEGSV
jgi:hypothetical protein